MKTSTTGQELIKRYEQLRLTAYLPTPQDVPTIGWGTTQGVKLGDVIDEETAQAYFERDLHQFEDCINEECGEVVSQNEFDACVSLAYNIGCKAFRGSTLVALIHAGRPEAAGDQFLRWNKQAGQVLKGLTARRQAEKDLFLS